MCANSRLMSVFLFLFRWIELVTDLTFIAEDLYLDVIDLERQWDVGEIKELFKFRHSRHSYHVTSHFVLTQVEACRPLVPLTTSDDNIEARITTSIFTANLNVGLPSTSPTLVDLPSVHASRL